MANPQADDGYTKIANEVLERLARVRIPGEARQVLDVVIRKTWGWKKKEDAISLSQFAEGTGLKKDKVIRARRKLVELNLITVSQKGNDETTIYRFNKDFDTWRPFPKKETFPKKEMVVSQKGNETYPKKEPTKEKKETVTKETPQPPMRGAVEEVFEFWKSERRRPADVLDRKRRRAIHDRIERDKQSPERLKLAVLGVRHSPHHMGENQGKIVFDDISLICRSGAQVDHFARLEEKSRERAATAPPRAAILTMPDLTPEELERSRIARLESAKALKQKWGEHVEIPIA